MIRVALVACGASKRASAAPARELYNGCLFQAARRDVDGRVPWFVVSALYGLVEPGQVIAPYDFRVTQLDTGERWTWAGKVCRALWMVAPGVQVVELHMGADYADALRPLLGAVAVEEPLRGLTVGRRLQRYCERSGGGQQPLFAGLAECR